MAPIPPVTGCHERDCPSEAVYAGRESVGPNVGDLRGLTSRALSFSMAVCLVDTLGPELYT